MGWIKKKFKLKLAKKKERADSAGANTAAVIAQPGLSPSATGNVLAATSTPEISETGVSNPDSDNFSFANFNWLNYMAHRSAPDSQTLESMEAEIDSGKGEMKYVWYPFELPMEDGSRTIAFKVTRRDAKKLNEALAATEDPKNSDNVESILFRNAQEVITTPSKSDIMRGTRPEVLVVRTPASFIDLMDDQVPDLREGFFVDPPEENELTPFRGGPYENLGVSAGFSVAQKICDILGEYLGSEISAEKVWTIVKRVLFNGFTPVTVFRLWKGILGGDLLNYVKSHPDRDVYDAITDWFAEWFAGDDIVSQVKRPSDEGEEIAPNTSQTKVDANPYNWDDLSNLFPTENTVTESTPAVNQDSILNSKDFDIAYVPVSFWKRLYSMGSNFSRRNRMPNFSSLVLSGSPTADLWLNKVPHIYIEDNGLPSLRYWEYAGVPLAGGLFKKIKNAVKKVGQVAKKVAKGVAKVMDSPLGGVISAIPVVGNIASVAGKVASGISKVTDKIDAMGSKVPGGGDESDTVDEASDTSDSGTGQGIARGVHSDLLINTTDKGRAIDVAALPTWSAPVDDPYVAPPLAMLASDPKWPGETRPLMFPSSRVPTEREALAMDACGRLAFLRNVGRLIEMRGPRLAMNVRNSSVLRPQTGSWARTGDVLRQSHFKLLAGGDVERELIAAALRQFGSMAEWTSIPALSSDSSTSNPFASTFFFLAASPGTKGLFAGNASASEGYAFNIPSIQIIGKRGIPIKEACLSAIIWAHVLVSASSLTPQQHDEILKAMQPAAIAGAWTGKSIDPLISLVLKGEWPSSSDARNSAIMKNWTRMVASSILFIWADAGGANTNSFSQSITQVMTPSIDATHNMLADFGSGSGNERVSHNAEQSTTASLEAAAKTAPNGHSPTGADAALNDVLASLRLQDPESGTLIAPHSDGLSQESSQGLDQFSHEADSYYAIASRICRESPSSRIAILRMNAAHIPSFIVTMTLRQYYPDYSLQDAVDTPMTAIPYSRLDFMTFGREGL